MATVSRFARLIGTAIVLAVPAVFVTIATYLACLPGHGSSADIASMTLWLTPGLLLRAMPVAVILGVFAERVWRSRYRPSIVLIAGLSGVIVGKLGTLNSPHVSLALASLSGGFAWMLIAACVLLLSDRKRVGAPS